MRNVVNVVATSCCVLVVVGLVMVGGCSAPENFLQADCNPEGFNPDPECRTAKPDAGTDAAPDVAGLRACFDSGGECVPKPSDENAYNWHGPAPVWIGPDGEKPTKCPFDAVIVAEKYAGLHAPPVDCTPCECETPTGTCAGVPDSISVGTTMCTNGGTSISFDGPTAWDGACTNESAIPAGAECPPGSGTPCTQSIAWSALPGPQNEACQVKTPTVPKFNGMTTSWETAAVACDSSLAEDLCDEGTQLCKPDALLPWVQCVWRDGVHDTECPLDYSSSVHVMYDHEPIDTRTCTPCSCGEPAGSACVAKFSIFNDSDCQTEIQNQTTSSMMPDCNLVFPAGLALGSKSVTNHLYLPGTCVAGGGEASGEATKNEATATTFCCRPGKIFVE